MKYCKHFTLVALSVATLALVNVGCDRTVSETEKTTVSSNGTVKTKDTTVTEHPDGSVTKTEEEKKTTPANP